MLRRWLQYRFVSTACARQLARGHEFAISRQFRSTFHTSTYLSTENAPLRKQLKDAARASKQEPKSIETAQGQGQGHYANWDCTIGIEIHAQLNTSSKLFSYASADYTEHANAAVWPFDLAIPGSQPLFQVPALVPALRAALALNCDIQGRSKFDRKHYFYHDQPAGYQITQYYEPFARNGYILLTRQDGLSETDGDKLEVGIKQIQLEQDTAKTQEQDLTTRLIDFNRSGHALIEIISLPHLHSATAAAAYVRKIQSILYAVDAATTGMELGGLRADVNVSVRRKGDESEGLSYDNVGKLGQRTEIKNLSSFKSVHDAVTAEFCRQVDVLEAGGVIEGETRGWSLSNPGMTRRLRGKEGEVDYRYMPDPDISPLYIHSSVIDHLQETLPPVPDQLKDILQKTFGLTAEDASTMQSLDDGTRLLYYQEIVSRVQAPEEITKDRIGVQVANWVLHELGALLTTTETQWTPDLILPQQMADLVSLQLKGKLTGTAAKKLLRILFDGDRLPVAQIVRRENLFFSPLEDSQYVELARKVIAAHPSEARIAADPEHRQARGKLKFLLGQMMRQGDRSRMEAQRAEAILQSTLQNSETHHKTSQST